MVRRVHWLHCSGCILGDADCPAALNVAGSGGSVTSKSHNADSVAAQDGRATSSIPPSASIPTPSLPRAERMKQAIPLCSLLHGRSRHKTQQAHNPNRKTWAFQQYRSVQSRHHHHRAPQTCIMTTTMSSTLKCRSWAAQSHLVLRGQPNTSTMTTAQRWPLQLAAPMISRRAYLKVLVPRR